MNCSRSKLNSFLRTAAGAAFLALAVLAFAPARGSAQQNPPSTSATTGAQPAPAPSAGGQTTETEDQGDAQFLHSSAVRSVARMLHLPLDVTVDILLGINFAIIFFAIAIPLSKAMPKLIRKRSQTLSRDLNDARKATTDAQARLSAVEAQLAGLGEEIKKLSAQVEQESLEDEKRIKASIGEESARIVAAAEQEIHAALAQAKRGLRTLAADLAVGQAEKQITLTPETDRALIAEFVAGVASEGKAAAAKGGRN